MYQHAFLFALFLGPITAHAARSCKPAVTVTEYVTVTGAPTPVSSLSTPLTASTSVASVTKASSAPEQPSSSAETKSQSSAQVNDSLPSSTASSPYADATEVNVNIAAKEQCGNDDRLIMPGMPWTVANSMYNSNRMVGTQCTNYNKVLQASDKTYLVDWTSTTNIENVADTNDICKGYSNIGIGKNLKKRLSEVKAIPAYYKWSRTIDGEFKGANIYDFITSPVLGAGEEPSSNEFMLFLKIWGGQVPIGYADGPAATFDMYGTTWKMYQGKNTGSGQTVRSMIPDTPFEGEFSGNLKVWLDAMVEKGYAGKDEYLNIGNCGVEVFYGNSHMDATVALDIQV
uniref:Uncharacterized protein n=2 Tax=Bionectria ochroleuca TaxID=29856 RepID=A0A0B7KHH6_BIOOC